MRWKPINATSLGDNEIVPAVPGMIIRIIHLWFIAPLAVSVSFKSAGNVKVEAMAIAANMLFEVSGLPNGWVVETNPSEAFVFNTSLAVNLRGGLLYLELVP